MKEIVLILEKEEYTKKENQIKEIMNQNGRKVLIYHTLYEDNLIRTVRNWKMVGNFLQHILYWLKSISYAYKIVCKNKEKDILSINPIVGLFLGLFNHRKKNRIILCGFLFEEKKNVLYYKIRKQITRKMLKGIEKIIVYSRREIAYYEKIFPEFSSKFVFIPYGIDYDIEEDYLKPLPEDYIFSGGGSNRDYKTLLEAYQDSTVIQPLCIATKISCLENLHTDKAIILTDVVLENFGYVLKKSKFLILSLRNTEISAGHQVLLQALRYNKIILINKIPAVEDYVSDKQVVFYKSGDSEELKNKMVDIIQREELYKKQYKDNSEFYKQNYTFEQFLKRLIKQYKDGEEDE